MTQAREQFEARYSIPAGVTWNDSEQRYSLTGPGSERQLDLYNSFWLVWRSSREDLVVTWPCQQGYTSPDCAGAAILDCRLAFDKAVRVSP